MSRTASIMGAVGGAAALFLSLFLTLPLKSYIKAQLVGDYYLEPVAASVGMLASFAAFVTTFALLGTPPILLWNKHHKQN